MVHEECLPCSIFSFLERIIKLNSSYQAQFGQSNSVRVIKLSSSYQAQLGL